MTGTCTRCHRTRNLARTDLCRPCYQTLWRAGTLPPAPPLPSLPTECTHNGRHTHGTRAMYVWDRCRCTPCRAANTRDQKANVHAVRHGQRALVDAAPVIAHLEQLVAAGVWWRQIAATSGVSRSALSKLRNGQSAKIRRATAARLLAITAANPSAAPHALVDATGTRRRLQALVALGYSLASLARPNIDAWRVARGTLVFEATRAAVATLYDELSECPPETGTREQRASVTRSQRFARAQGWAPPIAWDPDSLDDPEATPCGIDPERPLSIAEQVAELLDLGFGADEIAGRIGMPTPKIADRIRDPQLKAELRRRAA